MIKPTVFSLNSLRLRGTYDLLHVRGMPPVLIFHRWNLVLFTISCVVFRVQCRILGIIASLCIRNSKCSPPNPEILKIASFSRVMHSVATAEVLRHPNTARSCYARGTQQRAAGNPQRSKQACCQPSMQHLQRGERKEKKKIRKKK